jgi:fatty acid desaturase
MNIYSTVAQLVIALSVGYVWIFRFDNIVKEFKQYGLSDLTRTIIGATKIALATLLVTGIWFPTLVFIPALLMAFLMVCAQFFHFKVKNPWSKHLPSLLLLVASLFVALMASK